MWKWRGLDKHREPMRRLVRYREQLMRNRRRAEARGRALALTQGILAPVGWWRPAALEAVQIPAAGVDPVGKLARGGASARCPEPLTA